jgi:hypothetical protein
MPEQDLNTTLDGAFQESSRRGVHFARPDVESSEAGKKPIDFPAPSVTLQPTSILGRFLSIPTMWGDEFNAVASQLSVEASRVVSVIGD